MRILTKERAALSAAAVALSSLVYFVGCAGGGGSGNGASTGGTGGSNGTGGKPNTPSCKSTCDDSNACTKDTVASGSASDCNLECSYETTTACEDGDGCCAQGCTPDSDNDCTATTISAVPDDRRIAWNPGIPGGIPNRTEVCATIDAALGNGETDATSAIQSAIDACPEGQVVKIPTGSYRLTSTLSVQKGIVLRGDGPTNTKLLLDDSSVPSVIEIGWSRGDNSGVAVESGATKGGKALTLSDASQFEVGDLVLLDQLDDPSLVTTGDCTFFKRMNGGARSIGQIFEVESKDGNTIEVSSPLYHTYSSEFSPEVAPISEQPVVKYAGVEDLYATRTSDYGGQGHMIFLASAAYSWVKNVETYKVSGRHVSLETCYRCVVRDSYLHDAWNNNAGGTGYGITLDRHSSDSLVENNIVNMLNLPISLAVSGGGNVVAYNYVPDSILADTPAWLMPDFNTHCSFPYMELVEGNWIAQGATDNVHGGAGYITFYRNYMSGQHRTVIATGNVTALHISANNLYMNALGNVLWREGEPGVVEETPEGCTGGPTVYHFGSFAEPGNPCSNDPRVRETLLLHGNFDFVSNAVAWDPEISDHNLPPSLYLTGKPAFFGDLRFPMADPEGDPVLGELPAKVRYDSEFAP
jgi:hypothetical protein